MKNTILQILKYPYIEREYNNLLTSQIKRKIVEHLMENKIICKVGNYTYRGLEIENKEGYIKSISNGCWGYGGDSIAVEILEDIDEVSNELEVDNLYPSNIILNLNVDNELFNYIIKEY